MGSFATLPELADRTVPDRISPIERFALACFAAVACVLLSEPVRASEPSRSRIDPLLRNVGSGPDASVRVAAILRLPGLTPSQRATLEVDGIRFQRTRDGRVRGIGDLYAVEASNGALARIAGRGISVRVSRPLDISPTLVATAIETQAVDLVGHAPTPTQGPLGKQLTVAAIEPGINVFHPHFFRADGGAWSWVDVDGDEVFTPGVDAVDANLDGEVATNERLHLLDYGFSVGNDVGGYDDTFQTAWDYLYIDIDESGSRDFGLAGGFSESSPGYGEAMFLPDDANGDGVFTPDERLLLLGTSQVAAMWSAEHVWTRGVDLITAPPDRTYLGASYHGTATVGIMTGGQTHPFRSNRGLVPNADIVVVSYGDDGKGSDFSEALVVDALAWLRQETNASVVNNSWAIRGDRVHLDGSNIVDAAIDAASAEGVAQVCAAGNNRYVQKHSATMTSGGVASFYADLPPELDGLTPSEITFDLHWPADEGSFACTVQRPDGATHDVQEVPDGVFDGLSVDAFRSDSSRGWALLSIEVSNPSGGAVGAGEWLFDCTHYGADEFLVHAVISDGITWGDYGATFWDATESSTVISPGLADECITAAGYTIQHSLYGVALGELEPYSALGPRFDGAMPVDIAAPVDAVAPTNDLDYPNSYRVLLGTSAAAPQVSAIVALMKMIEPELGPGEIAQRIQDAGAIDEQVGSGDLPDAGWGYGRLRGYEALVGEAPPPRPRAAAIDLSVEYTSSDGGCAATVDVEGARWDQASFRWDFEYDGVWDTDFEPASSRELMFAEAGETFEVRVDAAERGFIVAGAILVGEVPATCVDSTPDDGTDASTDTEADTRADTGTSEPSDGTAMSETDGGGGAVPDGGDGCGCRSGHAPAPLLLALVPLACIRRRSDARRHLRGGAVSRR